MTEERRNRLWGVVQKRQFDLSVVLENVNDPHNISAVMRTCDAVGIQDLFILQTVIKKPKTRWGKKSSSSASKWLSIHIFNNADECFTEVRKKCHTVMATHLETSSQDLYATNLTHPTAIVFGNEHDGVSPSILPFTDGSILIPQVGIVKSLNISVACAVVLYEALRQKSNAGHYEPTHPRFFDEKQQLGRTWGLNE